MDAREDGTEALPPPSCDLVDLLARKVVGQANALRPYRHRTSRMYQAGLSSPDRPAGIFLLLGPTGTGKTRTVEALAEILTAAPRSYEIDCAEYQSDHEVAKLIGAPPGYVGHRETKPMLTQERLVEVVSGDSDLALVLFDEIEKAAPALTTLLLGMLDKATLRLGDNSTVNFEKSLIFLTSNLGAREMVGRTSRHRISTRGRPLGRGGGRPARAHRAGRGQEALLAGVRQQNRRRDHLPSAQRRIALANPRHAHRGTTEARAHAAGRPVVRHRGDGVRAPTDADEGRQAGIRGARTEAHDPRLLTQPLAALVADGRIAPGARVTVDRAGQDGDLTLLVETRAILPVSKTTPVVLILDDNAHLSEWLEREVSALGVATLGRVHGTAGNRAGGPAIELAIVDLVLPDGDGLSVARDLVRRAPRLPVVVMTGGETVGGRDRGVRTQEFSRAAKTLPLFRHPRRGSSRAVAVSRSRS